MSCTTYYSGDTIIHRLDPRPRIIVTVIFSLIVALTDHSGILALAVSTGVVLAMMSRVPLKAMVKRLLRLNLFMAVLFLLVPATFGGRPDFTIFSIPFSHEGLVWSLVITLKANAIVLVFAALMGTIELFSLGHAFHHLKVPVKLIHLFLFTLRYLDLLHHEYLTLLRAMKARGFRPRLRVHTYRTLGYLAAMILVRSLERSERVMAAMKCRGFRGDFHLVRHFHCHRRDLYFSIISSILLVAFLTVIYIDIWRLW